MIATYSKTGRCLLIIHLYGGLPPNEDWTQQIKQLRQLGFIHKKKNRLTQKGSAFAGKLRQQVTPP